MNAMNAISAMNAEYAQMTEALRWQQQRIIDLEAENRELRRQLDDLHRGVGVSVVIEGRQIPLAALAAASSPPSASAGPVNPGLASNASWIYGGHQAVPPMMAAPVPAPPPAQSPQPGAPVQRTFAAHQPAPASSLAPSHSSPAQPAKPAQQAASTWNSEGAFPEHAWLTGPAPAVKPAQRSSQQPAQRSARQPLRQERRSAEPSPQQPQRPVPPTWLREEAPTEASWDSDFASSPPVREHRVAHRQYLPHTPTPPIPAEPWQDERRQDSGQFPTLAKITGQHPAVRIPGKPKKARNVPGDERTPFSDSFVLG